MSILDNAKEVANAVHEIKNLDLYAKVLDLNRGIMDLIEESRKLHSENRELQEKLTTKEKMTFKEPFYFQDGDKTPFCSACWEVQKLPVHLKLVVDNPSNTTWNCPSCRQKFTQFKPGHSQYRDFTPPKSDWG